MNQLGSHLDDDGGLLQAGSCLCRVCYVMAEIWKYLLMGQQRRASQTIGRL